MLTNSVLNRMGCRTIPRSRSSSANTRHDREHELGEQGYTFLAEGCFGVVYRKGSSNRVVKIGHSYDAWLQYARYILDVAPKSPHLPTIHYLDQHINWYETELDFLHEVPYNNNRWRKQVDYVEGTIEWNDDVPTKGIPKSLVTTTRNISTHFNNKSMGYDFCSENAMLRKVGKVQHLVINDPYS